MKSLLLLGYFVLIALNVLIVALGIHLIIEKIFVWYGVFMIIFSLWEVPHVTAKVIGFNHEVLHLEAEE